MVIKSDYVGEDWNKPTDSEPNGVWEAKLKKRWTDGAVKSVVGFIRVDKVG
jgi:hypothetical protein